MRVFAFIAVLSLLTPAAYAANDLTFQDRIEITRGLTAEYATAKVLLPRSRGALEFDSAKGYDQGKWTEIAREGGPAARVGDTVQITKVDIGGDKIVLEINGGYNGGKKWWHNIQVGGGMGRDPNMAPIARDGSGNSNAPYGTSIAILFHKPLEPMKAAEIKKLLAPVLDFEKRSAADLYVDTLPPEVQKAVKEKRATVGMDREQVVMALGRPNHKSRETKEGVEVEDWIYGEAPGKFTFVTFEGDKVVAVKVSYAGLGSQVENPPVPDR